MEFGLLGPLVIRRAGEPVEVRAPKQRALLIQLLLRANHTVPVDQLIDGLWGEEAPPHARVTLRSYVSTLRRTLDEPGHEPIIVTSANGYGVHVPPGSIDAGRFERLAKDAGACLAAGDPHGTVHAVDQALDLWRGEALADVAEHGFATGERTRLQELRLTAEEDRFDALLALGRHDEAVAALEAFTALEPLRERARGQLMLALYRSGRAAHALAAFRQFRQSLVEELGLDPSRDLQELADRMLRQDIELLGVPSVAASVTSGDDRQNPIRSSPLVGRVHECRELRGALDRVFGGAGDLLLLAGEPGIGKTALLRELARLGVEAGAAVHWGRCRETRGAPAFWPWTQVLRSIAAEHSDQELKALSGGVAGAVTQLVHDIGQRLGRERTALGDDLEVARFQLYDAMAVFLMRAAEQRPLVVLLEDLHWADAPSLQALTYLAPLLGSGHLLIAATYRDVQADVTPELESTLAAVVREAATQQIGLVGLQPRAVAELVEQLTGNPVSDEGLELLHQRTAGNPFFVRQLAQLLDEEPVRDRATATIPSGVRHVITRRLAKLPDEVIALLEVGAVIGAQFGARRLAAAARTSTDDALTAADRAVDHGFLMRIDGPRIEYRFVHALVRETIYDELAPQRAARLHEQVATLLERSPNAPMQELAEHFWRAAEVMSDERAVRYLEQAADQALEVAAHEQAETCLRRALALTLGDGDPTVELGLRVRLLQLMVSIHGWVAELVEEIARPALELARASGLRTGILPLWMVLLSAHIAHGDHATANEFIDALLAQADEADDAAALAAGYVCRAYIDLTVGQDPSEILAMLHEAERCAGLAPAAHLQAVPHIGVAAAYLRAVALAHQEDRPGAIDEALRAVAMARRVSDPLSQAITHMIATLVGVVVEHPAFVLQMAKDGQDVCRRHGFQYIGRLITVSESWAKAQLGDDPARQARRMREVIGAMSRVGHAEPRAKFLLFTAETCMLADDMTSAEECLEEARNLSLRTGEHLPDRRLHQVEMALDAATRRPHSARRTRSTAGSVSPPRRPPAAH